MRKIEVDEATASALSKHAAERGMSVSELLAELVRREREPVAAESGEIAELDRRWKAVESGHATVPHAKVVRWLQTWGTPAYKPWPDQ